jgi:RNA polymerase sigma-70 factor (ECF subfamily)
VNVATFRLASNEAPTDRELVARTLAGDGAAYGTLVERHQKKIFRVAFAILRDELEADSITQDTFVQAYTHLSRFEGRSELVTWLTRIAINRSRDHLRRRKFLSFFIQDQGDDEGTLFEPADDRPDPERQYASEQLRQAIERAVEDLSAQQKVIFRLRHYENYALEEIADLLGLRAGTVRAHLFRAIHKIRKELSGWVTEGSSLGIER